MIDTPKLPGSMTGAYVAAVVALSGMGVTAIVAITLARPNEDNTPIITTVLGFLVPVTLGFLGAAVKEVHVAFNSRMTELLELTERSAKAEGQLLGSVAVSAAEGKIPGVAAVVEVKPDVLQEFRSEGKKPK